MAITKNRQTMEQICLMAKSAFPEKDMAACTELTEGMCNTAYLVQFTDGSQSVLKIAAQGNQGRMTNEVGLMEAEVSAMRLVQERSKIKVAQVQYYDTAKDLCSGDYFFMEVLEGQSFSSVGENYTEEARQNVHFEIGQVQKELNGITGTAFGLLGDKDNRYDNLFSFVYQLIANVLSDAEKKQVEIGIPAEEILSRLKQDKAVFEQVTQPVLVHWDMWEGNVFVKDGHVTGIIDWERGMWGEALMDDRFRRHTRNQWFLKGFGKEDFTDAELRRIAWYDVYLYLTMMTEGFYREYEDDGVYQWAKPMFQASWDALQENNSSRSISCNQCNTVSKS